MLTLKEFKEARGVLSGVIRNTSLVYSPAFSKATGNQIYIKPENMQVTGAYKIRGAYYKISTLSDEEKARGLVTASAGNHAQGVAYAAQAAGVSATIVMPTTTPLVKVNNTKDYGAKVVLHGETFDDAAELAAEVGADGVHVGQQDMSPRQARAILGPDGIVGVSAHTVEEARAAQAEGADYLGVGAVFVTGTKENTTPVDYETLKEICAAVDIPVVAIGGVGRNNLSSLAGSGIQGVAVVSALYAQPDVRAAARSLRSQVEEMLRG